MSKERSEPEAPEPENGAELPTLRAAPHRINVPMGAPLEFVLPEVYRYEDMQWIDQFFDSGKLRLSTFAKFATYKDEQRGDANEGQGMSVGHKEDRSIGAFMVEGENAFVLCGSLVANHSIREAMGRNAVFSIENPLGFAAEVARQLPGFRNAIQGHCIYRKNTIINRATELDPQTYELADGRMDGQIFTDIARELAGPERLLLKAKRYELQREYRLLWFVDQVRDEFIDIECPNARQFCRRVAPEELDPKGFQAR